VSTGADLVADLFEYNDAILAELVTTRLGEHLLVVVLEIAKHFGLALGDDADVDVGPGTQVVVDTCLDGGYTELDGLLSGHVLLVIGFHDGHGSEGAGAGSVVGVRVHITITRALNELATLAVNATDDEVGADLASVLESVRG